MALGCDCPLRHRTSDSDPPPEFRSTRFWGRVRHYLASGKDAWFAGALIYLEKIGCPSVGMRLGRLYGGLYDHERLRPSFDDIIDPAE